MEVPQALDGGVHVAGVTEVGQTYWYCVPVFDDVVGFEIEASDQAKLSGFLLWQQFFGWDVDIEIGKWVFVF